MPQVRDYSLPLGMSDLGDKIRCDEAAQRQEMFKHEQHMRQLRVSLQGNWLTTINLFDALCCQVDHDLLFTENTELVRPLINEIVAKEWMRVLKGLPLFASERARRLLFDASARAVEKMIALQRPRYLGDPQKIIRELRD